MPVHGHQHSSSVSGQFDQAGSQAGSGSGMLGSVGAPTSNLRIGTGIGNDTIHPSGGNGMGFVSGGQTVPPNISGLPGPKPNLSPVLASASLNSSHTFDGPRRAQTYGRQPEELHIPPNHATMGQQQSRELPQHHPYNSPRDYTGGSGPATDFDQPTPQTLQQRASTNLPLPSALQSGNPPRPGPSSTNTSPSTVPILPQISTQTQPYSSPSRSNTVSHSHSYSRSSPAGLDQQKYVPYVNTLEDSKFASTPSHKFNSSQTPQAYSPLGLADIRPRADSGLSDETLGANAYPYDGYPAHPTNCNYLAPWAVYAFDWCKWPVQQQGLGDAAGKMAIGSYLEDGHNFVRRYHP